MDLKELMMNVGHFRRRLLPNCFSGKTFKIWKARIADKAPGREGGTLIVEDGRLYLCCGDGALILEQVQIEGKKRMDADDFLRGARFKEGELI